MMKGWRSFDWCMLTVASWRTAKCTSQGLMEHKKLGFMWEMCERAAGSRWLEERTRWNTVTSDPQDLSSSFCHTPHLPRPRLKHHHQGSRGAGLHLHWTKKKKKKVCFEFELAAIHSLGSCSKDNKDKLLYQNQTVCNPQVAFSLLPLTPPPASSRLSVQWSHLMKMPRLAVSTL